VIIIKHCTGTRRGRILILLARGQLWIWKYYLNRDNVMNIDELMILAKNEQESFFCREGGAPEDEILMVEKALCVELPDDYRYFLGNYGAVIWFGEIIRGISAKSYEGTPDAERIYRVVARRGDLLDTLKDREKYKIYASDNGFDLVPENGVILGLEGGGGYYFLFCKGSPRSGQVAWFSNEIKGKEYAYWQSFADFIAYLLTGNPDPSLQTFPYGHDGPYS
jgi:hypothetical protein